MSEAALLSLVQWLSPAFPTGAFAYSHGLETEIAAGRLRDAPAVEGWIGAVLAHGGGWADAVLLARALAGDDPEILDDHARALAGGRERLLETLEQGAAFARAAGALGAGDGAARPLPVAVGVAARGLGLPPARVIALYLHAVASNLASAAVRFVPLGQTAGQALLARLHPRIDALAARAATAPLDAIATSAFGAELAAMEHETLEIRIFRT